MCCQKSNQYWFLFCGFRKFFLFIKARHAYEKFLTYYYFRLLKLLPGSTLESNWGHLSGIFFSSVFGRGDRVCVFSLFLFSLLKNNLLTGGQPLMGKRTD